jgi:hypothetical protein
MQPTLAENQQKQDSSQLAGSASGLCPEAPRTTFSQRILTYNGYLQLRYHITVIRGGEDRDFGWHSITAMPKHPWHVSSRQLGGIAHLPIHLFSSYHIWYRVSSLQLKWCRINCRYPGACSRLGTLWEAPSKASSCKRRPQRAVAPDLDATALAPCRLRTQLRSLTLASLSPSFHRGGPKTDLSYQPWAARGLRPRVMRSASGLDVHLMSARLNLLETKGGVRSGTFVNRFGCAWKYLLQIACSSQKQTELRPALMEKSHQSCGTGRGMDETEWRGVPGRRDRCSTVITLQA